MARSQATSKASSRAVSVDTSRGATPASGATTPTTKGKRKSKTKSRKNNLNRVEEGLVFEESASFADLAAGHKDDEQVVNLCSSSPVAAPRTAGSSAVIDLRSSSPASEAPAGPSRLPAGPSTPVTIGKGKARDTGSGSAYKPSTFTPLRSLLSGVDVTEKDDTNRDLEEGELEDDGLFSDSGPSVPIKDRTTAPNLTGKKAAKGKAVTEKEKETEEEQDPDSSVLLLPDHVQLLMSDDEDGPDAPPEPVVEGVHVVDDGSAKGAARYFMDLDEDDAAFLATADQSKLCRKCKQPGHKEYKCPHIVCQTCGAWDQHERRDCPWSMVCFGCGQRGHRKQDCPDPKARNSYIKGCDRCGGRDHRDSNCPLIWRVYVYRKAADRRNVLEAREGLKSWEAEACGGDPSELYCYNCAKEGHLGDNCPSSRGSLARAANNSAFSERIAFRGPYARTSTSGRNAATPQGKHTRWDDDRSPLPYVSAGFQGANAGKNGREKEKQRQRDADRNRSNNHGGGDRGRPRDMDDWFDRPRDRDRGSHSSNWRRDRSRSPPPRRANLWDSERRQRDRSPYGERDRERDRREPRSAPAKANRGGFRDGPADSPTVRIKGAAASSSLRQRVLGREHDKEHGGHASSGPDSPLPPRHAPQPSRRNKRGKEDARDWEAEWRASGAAGGNVSSWGEEMDGEARQHRDDRVKAGPARPGKSTPGGGRKGGQTKGQRYTGGY